MSVVAAWCVGACTYVGVCAWKQRLHGLHAAHVRRTSVLYGTCHFHVRYMSVTCAVSGGFCAAAGRGGARRAGRSWRGRRAEQRGPGSSRAGGSGDVPPRGQPAVGVLLPAHSSTHSAGCCRCTAACWYM